MSVDLELQKALRERLVSTPGLVQRVPARNVVDINQRPAPVPSIILGESQAVDEGTSLQRRHVRVFHTIHVWQREASLEGVKAITGLIRSTVNASRLQMAPGLHCADLRVSSVRHLRDPNGEHSHGVVTVEALVVEEAP